MVTIGQGASGGAQDTFIYRNQPYTNYSLDPLPKVAHKQTNASLIKFDLLPIPPGAIVAEAYLEVQATGWSGLGADITAGAYAVSNTVTISQTTSISPELATAWFIPGCNDVLRDRRELRVHRHHRRHRQVVPL